MSHIETWCVEMGQVKRDVGYLWGDSARLVMFHIETSHVTHRDESCHAKE